jgi:hypothetical protein
MFINRIMKTINNKSNQTILENETFTEPVSVKNCENVSIVNCHFKSNVPDEKQLNLSNCIRCKVINCEFHDKSTKGVALNITGAKTKDNLVEGCKWYRLTYDKGNGGEPLRLGNSEYSHCFFNTTVTNCTFTGLTADVETISNKSCGNVIENCTQENCKSSFVCRHGHTMTIRNCTFIGEGGIRLYGKDNKVQSCTFKDNRTSSGKKTKFPPIQLVNGDTKDDPHKDVQQGQKGDGHATYAQVRNTTIEGNTFENCRVCVVWGRDSRRFKPEGVKFVNNKVIAEEVESVVIEFSGGAGPDGNELTNNEVVGTKARIDSRIAKAFTGANIESMVSERTEVEVEEEELRQMEEKPADLELPEIEQ